MKVAGAIDIVAGGHEVLIVGVCLGASVRRAWPACLAHYYYV
jgi:hypothetical protein